MSSLVFLGLRPVVLFFWPLRFVNTEITLWSFGHKDIKLANGNQWSLSLDNMYHSSDLQHDIQNIILPCKRNWPL